MDGGTWLGYIPWGRKELDTTERLHSLTHSAFAIIGKQWDKYTVEYKTTIVLVNIITIAITVVITWVHFELIVGRSWCG